MPGNVHRSSSLFFSLSLHKVPYSIWLSECERVFSPRHQYAGRNAPLRTLFYRLGHFASLPLIPVFVFDGPHRPDNKRGKATYKRHHPLTVAFKQLIDAFGFHFHDVSGSLNMFQLLSHCSSGP